MLGLGLHMGVGSPRVRSSGFNIGDLSDLATWFKFGTSINTADRDGDGDNDITWTSSHTDGRTATQTGVLEKPTTTSGYIHFDGTNDNLDLSSSISLTTFTMFLAIDFDDLSNETVLGKTDDSQMFMRFGFQNLANKFRFRRGDGGVNNVDGVMSEDLTTGAVNLITIRSFQTPSTSNSTLKVERSTKSGDTITTNEVFSNTHTTFIHTDSLVLDTIGVQTTFSSPADMKLYEWVVFNADLSDSTRQNVQNDILTRIP